MPKHIYDKSFRYTKAEDTDLRKTFDRLCPGWREQKAKVTELKKWTERASSK